MLEKIKNLELIARELEPQAKDRNALFERMGEYAEHFLSEIDTTPAYVKKFENSSKINELTIGESPVSLEKLLSVYQSSVEKPGLNPASGGHLGYIPGGGLYTSALGDFLADIGNKYAGVYFAGPGAVKMENILVRWMADLVGYPETAGGNLASGGSIANLNAIVTARDARKLKAADFHRNVIYLTEQVHHCIDKAIRIAGMGEAVIRKIPLDDHFRMKADKLRDQIIQDKKDGLVPFVIVGSAGTTDTGAVDPISQIADVAEEHNVWLHVDAAYGGFFLLCEEGKSVLKDLHRSDSIVMDPHKTLFLPYGIGVVIVKDLKHMVVSHHYTANYMQDTQAATEEYSPADVSAELTKHFRGLRMWLPLMLHGLKPFRAGLSEKIWLCRYFYDEVQKIEGIEVGPKPELSVAIYRFVPNHGDANVFNKRLMEVLHEDGTVFLSSTTINEIIWIRIAVVAFRTHLHTIEKALAMLQRGINQVKTEFQL